MDTKKLIEEVLLDLGNNKSLISASYNRYEQQLVPSWTTSLKGLKEVEIKNS